MRKTRHLTPALTAALILVVVGILTTLGTYVTLAAESPTTDCLVDLQGADETKLAEVVTCEDGAACDSDGLTNQTCTIRVRATANKPKPGCTPQELKSIKVTPKKLGISVEKPSGITGSAVGAFQDIVLPLKGKNKDKPSKKKKIKAVAKAVAKKTKDIDKSKLQCVKCPTASCVPATTTTTTTLPPCGNGVVGPGETCDASATPNGCGAGTPFCNTTCTGCTVDCARLSFTLGAPTLDCGFPGQGTGAAAPLSGELRDANNMKTAGGDLGLGCLYIGGGIAAVVPPGPTPNGSETLIDVADCSVNALALQPADTGSNRNCTIGPKTTKHCTNGHPGTDTQGACTSDANCTPVCVGGQCVDGAPGTDGNGACAGDNNCGPSSLNPPPVLVCNEDPSCFFGNPLPILNSGLSTCVLNVIKAGMTGSADKAAGTAEITMPLKSWVYLTGIEEAYNPDAGGFPCPTCENGVCSAGKNKDQPCSTNSTLKVTHDCPPSDHLFLAPLDVTLGPLSSETVTATASNLGTCGTTGCLGGLVNCCSGNGNAFCATDADCDGMFCQGPPVQKNGGAFGQPGVRSIIQNGSPAAGGLDATSKESTLASVFCIPPTGSGLIDGSANLPGPGTTALPGFVRLQ